MRLAELHARGVASVERELDRVRRHRVLGEAYELLDGSIGDFARDHGPMYAGALAFYAILSLIPLVVLLASLSGFALAWGDEQVLDASLAEVMVQLRKVIPYIEPRFEDDLRVIIHNRRSLGAVGLVALLLSASEVFRAIEFALARIFARLDYGDLNEADARPRSYLKSKLWFGAFVTAIVILGITVRILFSLLRHLSDVLLLPRWLMDMVGDPLAGGSVLGAVMTAAAVVLGFVALVKVFTRRHVHTRYAFLGGTLFWMLLQAAHVVFQLYLERVRNIGAMYGSFAAPIIVILWIYFASTLLLFCCHITKAVQRRVRLGPRWPKVKQGTEAAGQAQPGCVTETIGGQI